MDDLVTKSRVFAAIFILANRMQMLGDAMDPRVTTKQWGVLEAVDKAERPDPSLSEIAQMVGTSRQNVKKLVVALEHEGLVRLRRDPDDARATRVTKTDECRRHLAARDVTERAFLADLFDGVPPDVVDGLVEGLAHLLDNVARMEDADLAE
ncbi:MAG: MarR family transcriptional regulator [Micrococcales bacterium]|nr:MarR family transcriptional regulator [Micrococcales bacterium]